MIVKKKILVEFLLISDITLRLSINDDNNEYKFLQSRRTTTGNSKIFLFFSQISFSYFIIA